MYMRTPSEDESRSTEVLADRRCSTNYGVSKRVPFRGYHSITVVLFLTALQSSHAHAQNAEPYANQVTGGARLILVGDFEGAVAALSEAAQAEPLKPDAFYLVGVAQKLKGDLDTALQTFRTAARIARDSNDTLHEARCVQAIADTYERMAASRTGSSRPRGSVLDMAHLNEAREAWSEVTRFAQAHTDIMKPLVSRARIQAIDQLIEQEQVYMEVRKRIK